MESEDHNVKRKNNNESVKKSREKKKKTIEEKNALCKELEKKCRDIEDVIEDRRREINLVQAMLFEKTKGKGASENKELQDYSFLKDDKKIIEYFELDEKIIGKAKSSVNLEGNKRTSDSDK